MRRVGIFWVIIFTVCFLACNKEYTRDDFSIPLNINIHHKAAGAQLVLDKPISNPFGEPLTITHFAYYLSHFKLIKTSGEEVELPVEYFLVNEKSAGSKSISLQLPSGRYKGIRMLVGVDSTRNVSGVQSGALDPANGMFWSWNSGYIFAKLEGKSAASTAPLQNVTYHIGGFKQGENALQMVELNFPVEIELKQGKPAEIIMEANADSWFDGLVPVRIANEAFCMDPGALAMKISANYATMFSIIAINQ